MPIGASPVAGSSPGHGRILTLDSLLDLRKARISRSAAVPRPRGLCLGYAARTRAPRAVGPAVGPIGPGLSCGSKYSPRKKDLPRFGRLDARARGGAARGGHCRVRDQRTHFRSVRARGGACPGRRCRRCRSTRTDVASAAASAWLALSPLPARDAVPRQPGCSARRRLARAGAGLTR